MGLLALVVISVGGSLLPGLAARVVGLQPVGSTDGVFDQSARPTPALVMPAALPASRVLIQAGSLGSQPLNVTQPGVAVALGGAASGQTDTLRVILDETALVSICQQYSSVCGPGDDLIRNVTFDLRPGGIIAAGDVLLPQTGIWQRVGVVFRLSGADMLTVMGVDIQGTLYTTPPGELAALVDEAERTVNEALRQLTIQAGGGVYALRELYVDDTYLTLLLR